MWWAVGAGCTPGGRANNRIRNPPTSRDSGGGGGGQADATAAADSGEAPPADGGTMMPPADGGTMMPPADAGTMMPPADGGTMMPPADGGTMMPPTDGGTMMPPADAGMSGTPMCPQVGTGQPITPRGGITSATQVVRQMALQRPAAGGMVTDPAFGTTIRRVSAESAGGPNDFETHIYSQLQAVSYDNRYLLTGTADDYLVRCLSDFRIVRRIDALSINNPRWMPGMRGVLLHYDSNNPSVNNELIVQMTNIETGQTTDVGRVMPYTRIRPSQSFDEISHDGRWIAGLAVLPNQEQEIFTYDLTNRQLGARINVDRLGGGRCNDPDWVAPSPLGDYLVVQWVADGEGTCEGLSTYNINTGDYIGTVHDSHPHGDLGLVPNWQSAPADRRQFFMAYESYQGGFDVSVGYRYLPGGRNRVSPSNVVAELTWGNTSHVSCQGPAGGCLVSTGPGNDTGGGTTPGWQPFENELFIAFTDGSVRRLAHHRTTLCGYWSQPRASWSRDGRFIVWASDWGMAACRASQGGLGNSDPYIIDLGP